MSSTVSPTHLLGKTVFPQSLHIPAPFRLGQESSRWVSPLAWIQGCGRARDEWREGRLTCLLTD